MNIKKLGIIIPMCVVVTLILIPTFSLYAQDKMVRSVLIHCDATGITSIDPPILDIILGDSVKFTVDLQGGCSQVLVSGDGPIGPFTLTASNLSDTTDSFNECALYNYTVTDQSKNSLPGKIRVTRTVPSLTTYGIILLILLLLVSTVWVIRKKKAGVPA